MNKPLKQYAVWEEDDDTGYWCLFDSLEDAVSDHENEEVYEMNAKLLGVYKRKVSIVKSKKVKNVKN